MADAAARREARRKRILENSHNRLQLISGKNSDELPRESTNKSPIPEIYEPTIITNIEVSSDYSLLNGILGNVDSEVETTHTLPSRHDVVAAGDGEVVNDLAAFAPSSPPEQPQTSPWTTLVTFKYDIVLLSLLLQFIHGVASIPMDNTYFFLPLIIYSVTKLVWFPKQSNSNIAHVLLLLNGLSASRLHKMLEILKWSSAISQDICVYLFTTICIQTLFITLKDSLVT
ncbi:uncharacterized protein LOC114354049 [Ostrinia furnacalis]|uniref:uncharacterized protein LOC114354049 n=1 Tax=Ostrinia furnacalis TaxID=93504 RepID=UPI00103C726A|nr:uncharacterized protein LOC114354049 [Ostrinia furnacalis]